MYISAQHAHYFVLSICKMLTKVIQMGDFFIPRAKRMETWQSLPQTAVFLLEEKINKIVVG